MKLTESIQESFESLKKDPPGKRFENFFVHLHRLGLGVRITGFILGCLLTALGFLLGLVPGVPGIVLGFLGIALIAAQFKKSALFADRAEITLRKAFSRLRGFFVRPAARHVDQPFIPATELTVNGAVMKIVDDGQHTGLESRFEEEMAKVVTKKGD